MKKLLGMGLCLLAMLLMLICSAASAQAYVTLAELREQIKAGWNETYSAKGREVVADVEVLAAPAEISFWVDVPSRLKEGIVLAFWKVRL